jgi:hypothetical protein
MMDSKILRFRIEFITSEEDCDEVTGTINDEKRVVELIDLEEGKNEYRGFIPFSSIKKLEIINDSDVDESSEE